MSLRQWPQTHQEEAGMSKGRNATRGEKKKKKKKKKKEKEKRQKGDPQIPVILQCN